MPRLFAPQIVSMECGVKFTFELTLLAWNEVSLLFKEEHGGGRLARWGRHLHAMQECRLLSDCSFSLVCSLGGSRRWPKT